MGEEEEGGDDGEEPSTMAPQTLDSETMAAGCGGFVFVYTQRPFKTSPGHKHGTN